MVTNLTEGYAVVTGVVGGVQLHGSSGARSSRLLMRGRSSMGAGFNIAPCRELSGGRSGRHIKH